MKNIAVFDLDGTLSIVGDRIKFLQQENKTGIRFMMLAIKILQIIRL